MRKMIGSLLATFTILFLAGCLLPGEPSSSDFSAVSRHSDFTVRTLARPRDPNANSLKAPPMPQARYSPAAPGMRSRAKNLLFLTADNLLETQFQPMISKAYGTSRPPTLNELSWWEFVPVMRDLYDRVIYLPLEQARHENILSALHYLESQGLPYDVILLSHGYPNYLTDGKTGYFLSFKEIDDLKGQLPNLNLVFTQACYSHSLAPDWLATGAKTVISFDGLNRNFFFVGVFLDRYRYLGARQAFREADQIMPQALQGSALYSYLIEKGLGLSVPDYLASVDEPIIETTR